MTDLDVHLEGIVARDQKAFGYWLRGAEMPLRRALRRFAASVDVECVVQETMLRIWLVAPRHRPDGRADSLLRLATTIATRLAIDAARRTDRLVPYEEERETVSEQVALCEPMPDPLFGRVLKSCLGGLAGKPAQALRRRLAAGGESDDELAALAGMAVNTFRQNVSRARRAVTECLARHRVRLEEHLP